MVFAQLFQEPKTTSLRCYLNCILSFAFNNSHGCTCSATQTHPFRENKSYASIILFSVRFR